jgi:tripartite-type tricarboxylate transporter receptor subunit TctC
MLVESIVPLAACRLLDLVAFVIEQKMQERRGQPVIIESRPGASTLIGAMAAFKSPADGYTLIVSVRNHTTNPAMRSKMPYNTLKDFAPISLVALAA